MSSWLADRPKAFAVDSIRELTDREFKTLQAFIYREAGISLSDAKRTLVYSRLAKRLRELNFKSFTQYIEYLTTADRDGRERQQVINCLTTNKTEFFREPHHFDFLRDVVFPHVRQQAMAGGPKQLSIWSSASSSGEEPYSIAISILEHFGDRRGWKIEVLATDINTEVLRTASSGIYPLDRLEGLPTELKQKYFLKGTGSDAGQCRVRPNVRDLVTFRQLNLLAEPLPVPTGFDVIFCRNVIIYFDLPTQQKLLPQFAQRLKPTGHLMLGHSENVPWLSDIFEPLGSTVHRLRSNQLGPQAASLAPVSTAPVSTARVSSAHASAARGSSVAVSPALRPAKPCACKSTPATTKATTPASPSTPNKAVNGKAPTLKRHNLLAGETFATREALTITTILGSCVAACLYDPTARVGGMNHFMLPYQTDDRQISARYGIHAMELLINEIMSLGGDRQRLKAKVFGGSRVLCSESPHGVGSTNVEFIRQFLATEQIPITAEKLGCEHALRVNFVPPTGQAFVKTIVSSQQLFDSEKRNSEKAWSQYDRQANNSCVLF
jgi:chemotaxis protein methyltransferase CheR